MAGYSTGLSESLACNLHSFVWQLVILPSACQETHNRFIVPVNKSFKSSQTYYCRMQRESPCPSFMQPHEPAQAPVACKHRSCAPGAPRFVGTRSIQTRCTCAALYRSCAARRAERDSKRAGFDSQTLWCRESEPKWTFYVPTQADEGPQSTSLGDTLLFPIKF